MKKILFIALILVGCQGQLIEEPRIDWKSYVDFYGDPMPSGICRFGYKQYTNRDHMTFQDSCHFYMVGDKVYGDE